MTRLYLILTLPMMDFALYYLKFKTVKKKVIAYGSKILSKLNVDIAQHTDSC